MELGASPLNVFQGTAAYNHNYPKVAVDANGNATLIWLRYNFSSGSIYDNINVLSATLPFNSSSWGVPSILTPDQGQTLNITNISTRISVDTYGNAIAFWSMSYDGSSYNVESAVKLYGGSWTLRQTLQIGILFPYQVDVDANNSAGSALAAYMLYDGVASVVIVAQETNISTPVFNYWQFPITISQGTQNGYPRVATSLNGSQVNAVAVWINFNGTSNVINAVTSTNTMLASPTGLSVTQSMNNYNVFTECSNTLRWTASTSPSIAKYNIYRDGVYFTSTNPNITQVVDHNAANSGTVIYGVVAQDTSASVSTAAQISFTPP